ncbi:MAG: glycosyl hydrolase 53 family protein [Muribaculaceae bacterium]|nr:glycosyl hydrolase 53 family protein [Muribaculaceae bacterium]MBR3101666.1 glycosyl hydrolase 53 family protein [Muribaculaceae bacterium]
MKRYLVVLLLLAVLLPASAKRWLGGDISMLTANERAGVEYRDLSGRPVDALDYFKRMGWNMMRVRLFVDPRHAPGAHHDQGVCQDLPYVIDLCQRIKRAGFKIMLDFHYSDTWADPAKQFMPHRWLETPSSCLPDSVYAYTRDCLTAMVRAGVAPDMIQVGNEITYGMMWPVGRVDPLRDDNWDVFASLLKGGVRACREVCPRAKIIIHTEKAGVWEMTEGYYKRLAACGVDYDIIGLSYYPMWHNTIAYLGTTLDHLAQQFPHKPVMIVETAYYYLHDGVNRGEEDFSQCLPGTIEGQREFTAQLVAELRRHKNVTGLFWWFPEENSYGTPFRGHGLNRGLFNNSTGCALPAMSEFSRFR